MVEVEGKHDVWQCKTSCNTVNYSTSEKVEMSEKKYSLKHAQFDDIGSLLTVVTYWDTGVLQYIPEGRVAQSSVSLETAT